MAKAKSKGSFKDFLLKKGEYLALGLAGFFLVVLFGWGVSRWAGAKDPEALSKKLTSDAQNLQRSVTRDEELTAEAKEPYAIPDWLNRKPDYLYAAVPARELPLTGPQFDPIARPDTKRERPNIIKLDNYQVDIVKVPMIGYDIQKLKQGEVQIGMITAKAVGEQDKKKLEELGKKLSKRVKDNQKNVQRPPAGGVPPGAVPPGMGPGGMPPMGMPPMGAVEMGGNPYGGMGGTGYNVSAQRIDKAVKYRPIDELDKAMAEGEIPAKTVIPLRAVIIHAEVPYRAQLEEIKRALRLPNLDEARRWGPIYDGYEVQRRVTRIRADGKLEIRVDWPADGKPNFDFEARYADLINSRKLKDNFEDGYMAHFIRYDMALALPLPQLVEELGKYPNIRLPEINATVKKLQEANVKPETESDILKRLTGRGDRIGIYTPQNGTDTASNAIYGMGMGADGRPIPPMAPTPPMPGTPMPGAPTPAGMPRLGETGTQTYAPPVEIDHLLLRLIDVDVEPGFTYEYRIRLRMLNPNYGDKMLQQVSNPAFTKDKVLESKWTVIDQAITIPNESFVFAADPAAYRKKIEEEFKAREDREIRERLQVKDNQAVVEMCTWMEEVPIGSGKREPVGAWVVADMPVGRGEFLGRKTYIKLPLWSSVGTQYVLREVPDKLITRKLPGAPDPTQPKGWLVDFTTRSVLADFEGGRVRTPRPGSQDVVEDVGTEMLIVRADGKLEVKSSIPDDNPRKKEEEELRQKIVAGWDEWVKKVETRPASGTDTGFDRKDKKDN